MVRKPTKRGVTAGVPQGAENAFVSILSRRPLRRGIFTITADLKTQLPAFIGRCNPTAERCAWTYAGSPLKA
jgi:hypothetical protein